MKITTITVAAERCFNHPYEQYSNLRPRVEFAATLVEGDDPDACTRELQAKAETSVEQHKKLMLEQIEHLEESKNVMQELSQMESTMRRAQERWTELVKKGEELGVMMPGLNRISQQDGQ